jgi:lipid-A-disaccharide synthase
MTLVYLVAGEASGDVLGGRLMAALREARPDIRFAGVGGQMMAAQGLDSLFPMQDLALMGLVEVLPNLRRVRRRLEETRADIERLRPDAIVTIDSPGFTLRLLRKVAPLGIPRAHYVAPQAWAWRESRVKSWPGLWERLLCLLPFEPAFFARHGIDATFVGHPVLESGADSGDAARFRARHALPDDARVLIVMPGSRMGEIKRHMAIFGDAVALLAVARPGLLPVLPVAPNVARAVETMAAAWPVRPMIVADSDDKYDAFAAAEAALAKSGTSTVELALARVPTVLGYRVHPITAEIGRRIIRIRYASIINLIADAELIPEHLQERCTPILLAQAVGQYLDDRAAADAQRASIAPVVARLAAPGGVTPSAAAAAEVLGLLRLISL